MNLNAPPMQQETYWQTFFQNNLLTQVFRLTQKVEAYREEPALLEKHFDSILTTFETAAQHPTSEIRTKLIDLVRTLHPFPIWWGKWSEWMRIMSKATALAHEEEEIKTQLWLQLQRTEMLITAGHGEEALNLAQKTAQLAIKEKHHEMIFRAELFIFEAKKYLGHIQVPIHNLEKLSHSLQNKKLLIPAKRYKELDILFSMKQSRVVQSQGNFKKALRLSQHAFALSKESVAPKGLIMAQVHNRIGGSYWANSKYKEAIVHLNQAREIYQRLGDQISEIDTMGDIGLTYWSAAKYREAGEILEKSISLAESVNTWQWQTIQTGDLALVYFCRGNLNQAAALMKQQDALAKKTNNYSETERANSNMANVYLLQGDFEQAYQSFERSLKNVEERKLKVTIGIVRAKIAWALEGLGRYEEALAYANSALEHAKTTESQNLVTLALRALSETVNNPGQGIPYAQEALEMATKQRHPINQAGALLTLARYEKNPAHYEEAAQILEKIGAENWLQIPVVFRSIRLPLII